MAFTPPVETFCARRFGVDSKGLPLAKKPDGDVSDLEWIRPGTAEDRQKIVARSRRPTSVPSLQYDSCPSHEVVGGLLFDFEPIHSCRDRDSRRPASSSGRPTRIASTTMIIARCTTPASGAGCRPSIYYWRKAPIPSARTSVRSRRPAALWCLRAVDATRLHQTRPWVVLFSILSAFRARSRLDPPHAGGQNALMLCADFLHVPLIDLLLSETEISIESKNVDGETALHYAALRGSMEAVEALLEFGANVNCESYARDTPLKRACRQQRVDLVHKLLDYDCNRRPSAFAILEGEALMEITLRLDEEKRKKVEEYEKLKRLEAAGKNKKGKKSAIGAWVPYRDKRGRGIFYYNRVSRVSQFEVPEDYEKDRRYLMKDATFGMHFYH